MGDVADDFEFGGRCAREDDENERDWMPDFKKARESGKVSKQKLSVMLTELRAELDILNSKDRLSDYAAGYRDALQKISERLSYYDNLQIKKVAK